MTTEEFLARYCPPCFFHFTDRRNLDSIRAIEGLFPLKVLRAHNVHIVAAGGNEWSHEADERVGLDQYLHLCLLNQHPMEYQARQDGRIQESAFLRIDRSVIRYEGIRFTADVSNKVGVDLLSLEQACEVLDFAVIYDRTNWKI